MSLFVVATPIGTPDEISRQAVKILESADVIIGEEAKVARAILKSIGLPARDVEQLNEHSDKNDLEHLAQLCTQKNVALISDCGTPGFCDPGSDLVKMCRQQGIQVRSIPGPSSLMAFLSVCGHRLNSFLFQGFLPRDRAERQRALVQIEKTKQPTILMDTPYRLKALLEDIQFKLPKHQLTLGLNLGMENEQILEGKAGEILKQLEIEKAEFILLVHRLGK